jgi:hypothetical protein
VRVNRIRFGSFVAASALSGIGAVVTVAALGSYNATTSDSYQLPVFASVFLGTAVIQPGRFNPIGTWIGIYFLTTGITGLEQLGLQTWVSDVFYGGVLVIAVTIATLRSTELSARGPEGLGVALAGHELAREGLPGLGAEAEHGAGTSLLGVAHEHQAFMIGQLHAVVAAVTGLPPAVYVFHSSSATFKIKSREATRGKASPLTRSKATAVLST